MISIIIPNNNGKAHLEKLLPTIARQAERDFEVLLVDNASADLGVETAKTLLPELKVVALERNFGFAAACNRGAEAARGDALFFLNNDTVLDPRCLKFCREALENHPGKSFFQPKIIRMGQNDVLDAAGDLFPPDGRPVHRGIGARSSAMFDPQILSPCGAASLWRKAAFDSLGGFEESFFAYLEDVDLGLRAILSGHEGLYIPDATVYHLGGGAAKDDAGENAFDRPEAVRWVARNKIWLWARCLPASALVSLAPRLVLGFVKSAAHHTFRSGSGASFWRGTIEGASELPRVLRDRRRIQSERSITLKEFMNWIKRT